MRWDVCVIPAGKSAQFSALRVQPPGSLSLAHFLRSLQQECLLLTSRMSQRFQRNLFCSLSVVCTIAQCGSVDSQQVSGDCYVKVTTVWRQTGGVLMLQYWESQTQSSEECTGGNFVSSLLDKEKIRQRLSFIFLSRFVFRLVSLSLLLKNVFFFLSSLVFRSHFDFFGSVLLNFSGFCCTGTTNLTV